MATFLPPVAGVSYSVAFAESAARARLEYAMLECYDLWHPTLAEPLRFVNDVAVLMATLEATAPRDASQEVEFLACPLSIELPEESDSASNPSIVMGRPDVSGLLKNALDGARGSRVPWTLIERIYASNDTTEPHRKPVRTYELDTATLSLAFGSFQANYNDTANEAIPRKTFTRIYYPGLVR